MLENLKKYEIILASKSPRRKEILKMIRLPFHVVTLDNIDESYPENMPLHEVPLHISEKKAMAYLKRMTGNNLIITADTLVIFKNRIMGKPKDREEAIEMLSLLSGESHEVVTGVTLATKEKKVSFKALSIVKFARLSREEIVYYVDDFLPLDKAGAYGIQEWIGAVAVKEIDGSFYNVMGLPIHLLYQELKKF